MKDNELSNILVDVLWEVKTEYGQTLKTQDHIYVVYGRVLDKISDHDLSFEDLNLIADLIRKGVLLIEKEKH